MYPAYDKGREAELMDILGIRSMEQVTIIRWNPPGARPQEDRYVLLKYYAPDIGEVTFELCAYERAGFFLTLADGSRVRVPEEHIRGWAYPVYSPPAAPHISILEQKGT